METRIKSFQYVQGRFLIVTLFGHTSKGLPGLEIIGQGLNMSILRSFKEKFIYISKELGLKIPPLKYVVCVDCGWDPSVVKNLSKNGHPFLELPALILFWSMAGIIPIRELHDCYAQGSIDLDKRVFLMPLKLELFPQSIINKNPLKVIGISEIYSDKGENTVIIPLNEIFGQLSNFTYSSFDILNH